MIKINSESLICTESHFKVSAGPGAGKTYWLVRHIENVLQNSERLSPGRKIACITYTNVGVRSILNKLGTSSNKVEVSTIHSFLYRHVLKPYCSFIPLEYELNIANLDGHVDPFVNFGNVNVWINNHSKKDELKHPYTCRQLTKFGKNKVALNNWLLSLHYEFDSNKKLKIVCDDSKAIYIGDNNGLRLSNECLKILESDLMEYKKLYWKEGIIDHEDVLFFSYKLIEKYPFILTVLRAKFPYFFIDEFQDTNPIQYEIVKKIGREETIIGVIGDHAQSIYGFQGAKLRQFIEFSLPDMKEYTIHENKRSTNKIISVLNHIRKDIEQKNYRNDEGDKPIILVGECKKAYNKAKALSNNEDVYSLSRRNVTSNIMKQEFEEIDIKGNILDEFKEVDGDFIRYNTIISCIKATEYARSGQYSEAMKQLRLLVKKEENVLEKRRKIVSLLYLLLNNYDTYRDKPLIKFYNLVKENINNGLSGFKKDGRPYKFYKKSKYKELALYINNENDASKHQTIHKAKGNEFENVMLILKRKKDLDFLTKPDLRNNEEHRVYYVAVSRARDRLFINVPELPEESTNKLKEIFKIEMVG